MTEYLVAIGGTGRRVALAYLSLCRLTNSDPMITIVLDGDGLSPYEADDRKLLELYQSLYNVGSADTTLRGGAPGQRVREIDLAARQWTETTTLEECLPGPKRQPYASHVTGYVARLHFSEDHLKVNPRGGGNAQPPAGAAILSLAFSESTQDVVNQVESAQPNRVFLVGSMVGATGAGGLPQFARLLREKERAGGRSDPLTVEGLFLGRCMDVERNQELEANKKAWQLYRGELWQDDVFNRQIFCDAAGQGLRPVFDCALLLRLYWTFWGAKPYAPERETWRLQRGPNLSGERINPIIDGRPLSLWCVEKQGVLRFLSRWLSVPGPDVGNDLYKNLDAGLRHPFSPVVRTSLALQKTLRRIAGKQGAQVLAAQIQDECGRLKWVLERVDQGLSTPRESNYDDRVRAVDQTLERRFFQQFDDLGDTTLGAVASVSDLYRLMWLGIQDVGNQMFLADPRSTLAEPTPTALTWTDVAIRSDLTKEDLDPRYPLRAPTVHAAHFEFKSKLVSQIEQIEANQRDRVDYRISAGSPIARIRLLLESTTAGLLEVKSDEVVPPLERRDAGENALDDRGLLRSLAILGGRAGDVPRPIAVLDSQLLVYPAAWTYEHEDGWLELEQKLQEIDLGDIRRILGAWWKQVQAILRRPEQEAALLETRPLWLRALRIVFDGRGWELADRWPTLDDRDVLQVYMAVCNRGPVELSIGPRPLSIYLPVFRSEFLVRASKAITHDWRRESTRGGFSLIADSTEVGFVNNDNRSTSMGGAGSIDVAEDIGEGSGNLEASVARYFPLFRQRLAVFETLGGICDLLGNQVEHPDLSRAVAVSRLRRVGSATTVEGTDVAAVLSVLPAEVYCYSTVPQWSLRDEGRRIPDSPVKWWAAPWVSAQVKERENGFLEYELRVGAATRTIRVRTKNVGDATLAIWPSFRRRDWVDYAVVLTSDDPDVRTYIRAEGNPERLTLDGDWATSCHGAPEFLTLEYQRGEVGGTFLTGSRLDSRQPGSRNVRLAFDFGTSSTAYAVGGDARDVGSFRDLSLYILDKVDLKQRATWWFPTYGLSRDAGVQALPSEIILTATGMEKYRGREIADLKPIADYSIPYLAQTSGDWERGRVISDLKWFSQPIDLTNEQQELLRRKYIELVLLQACAQMAVDGDGVSGIATLVATYPLSFSDTRRLQYRETLNAAAMSLLPRTGMRIGNIEFESEGFAGLKYGLAVLNAHLNVAVDIGGGTTDVTIMRGTRVAMDGRAMTQYQILVSESLRYAGDDYLECLLEQPLLVTQDLSVRSRLNRHVRSLREPIAESPNAPQASPTFISDSEYRTAASAQQKFFDGLFEHLARDIAASAKRIGDNVVTVDVVLIGVGWRLLGTDATLEHRVQSPLAERVKALVGRPLTIRCVKARDLKGAVSVGSLTELAGQVDQVTGVRTILGETMSVGPAGAVDWTAPWDTPVAEQEPLEVMVAGVRIAGNIAFSLAQEPHFARFEAEEYDHAERLLREDQDIQSGRIGKNAFQLLLERQYKRSLRGRAQRNR